MEKYTYKPNKMNYGKKIYFGNLDGDEFFIKPVSWDCGWYWGGVYLEGLRASTEDELKKSAGDCELSDYYDIKDIPCQYLDEEQFQKDMEDSWEERADISERQERNGEEVCLCFGTWTHADSVLLNDCKGDYKTALEKFDKLLFTEEQFNKLIDILKRFYTSKYQNQNNKKYLKSMEKSEEILEEFETFTENFDLLPKEEFWTD
jgi:hypothetical protein|tara:strand:- start:3420 stop:4031 length:612 start_codon:yes stop_codon:yes gene_type:complete